MRLINRFLPHSLIGRLTFMNVGVIAVVIIASSWGVYNTACFLAEGLGGLDEQRQLMFNRTLANYLITFIITSLIAGGVLHFYLTKKLIKPVRELLESTKQLRGGQYPEPLPVNTRDELGLFVEQYNALIAQLKTTEAQRVKLVQDLSHEFRTPLSNLNGYLNALSKGDIEGDPELFASLHEEAKRLTSMVEQLDRLKEWDQAALSLSSKREQTNMKDLIHQCAVIFDWTLKQQGLNMEISASEQVLSVHQEGIQQVLSNLLDNAIRYYDGSGPIKVEGQWLHNAYQIRVAGPSAPLSEEQQEHIFERFYRLDPSRSRDTGGSGLGLSIAQEIVTQHGGTIKATHDTGTTTVTFTLPDSKTTPEI
ncbi:Histidine kinase [Lentibacillus sp. JNUCC-1]|uniref:sensor histidine kinase n=1 Tax=Lentibacillus sp. JNUCC-1 TaxID=2654513 RepID=UPI0012E91D12|nr:ATP-binding protein [Lentibacillus sp. JNUCC-1]MUV38643.1 Histidine kinase [Lentibacillus sp. JNUCC-1]